jgi:hypothetical protein
MPFNSWLFTGKRLQTKQQRFKEGSWMFKKTTLLICSLFVCSCHYSGHLVEKPDTAAIAGTVPHRTGTVPYRNDAHADARRGDAVRKIAKFCGSDSYTVTHEGISSTDSNLSEIDFRCGEEPTAPAAGGTVAPSKDSGTPGNTRATVNPNVAPSDFDHP